ncbi:MAG: prolyl oligopeptidase family serine peptidase, partial [Flavobacteriales bacterium]|nr:prolyl oligopeptidase family serine peptidase [Flavobacteriales bacterium]
PYFSRSAYSYIDRGFVYAIAHVRGGDDLGRHWYEDGKLLNKKNTFNDFIACIEHLIKHKYTSEGKVVARGASAGGLLMGVLVNERPELFNSVLLDVPFVDVINTMLDSTLPLTTGEYEEWGNPNIKEYFEYIYSYSPYDNIKKQEYPHMLFRAGLTDEQVGFWEPAKMVAKLRDYKTDDNKLLFLTTMSGGHAGPSGRYAALRETAFDQAFVLSNLGIKE